MALKYILKYRNVCAGQLRTMASTSGSGLFRPLDVISAHNVSVSQEMDRIPRSWILDLAPRAMLPTYSSCGIPCIISPVNTVAGTDSPMELAYRDDIRREQFNRIVGKVGIRKRDAGVYWKQYKQKRMKIRKRRRVI
ncbi:uncharacterized protein BBOV_IV001250 [Babesia bovis T2Bo]|uniref:Uncharacterized protein n=1 Tax=Babesia bovis TaxID=5865 RepID=A7AV96_BABBO|nr:uncharacterized protein BBOV_IV001250 [Babesia bovis T2Bo]EDO05722.1 hypothetical protein BBOV_IV001250 [Babesia bovis T2Bo]|eukprot:XP_001609290.1 hypothetical protein [Babesia bovis T2Bo]